MITGIILILFLQCTSCIFGMESEKEKPLALFQELGLRYNKYTMGFNRDDIGTIINTIESGISKNKYETNTIAQYRNDFIAFVKKESDGKKYTFEKLRAACTISSLFHTYYYEHFEDKREPKSFIDRKTFDQLLPLLISIEEGTVKAGKHLKKESFNSLLLDTSNPTIVHRIVYNSNLFESLCATAQKVAEKNNKTIAFYNLFHSEKVSPHNPSMVLYIINMAQENKVINNSSECINFFKYCFRAPIPDYPIDCNNLSPKLKEKIFIFRLCEYRKYRDKFKKIPKLVLQNLIVPSLHWYEKMAILKPILLKDRDAFIDNNKVNSDNDFFKFMSNDVEKWFDKEMERV